MERHNHKARFKDIVAFIERQVKMSSDPLFGDIQSTQPVQQKSQSKTKIRNSFAMMVVTNSKSIQCYETELRSKSRIICLCCKRDHLLDQCTQMQNKLHREKLNFKEKGICFGCLCVGHMSRDCDKRLTCAVCGQMHQKGNQKKISSTILTGLEVYSFLDDILQSSRCLHSREIACVQRQNCHTKGFG